PKAVEKLPELKELPPKWKYVFLGGDPMKPVIISSLLTPVEEEDMLKEVERDNDGLVWDLDGVIPIFYVPLQEVPTPILQVLMKDESVGLDETDTMSTTSDIFRVKSV
ncbi:hypothetical protein A2U01_0067570, partial [Trifolium medium]|nr:hypothetical protein [Trifolium medium]